MTHIEERKSEYLYENYMRNLQDQTYRSLDAAVKELSRVWHERYNDFQNGSLNSGAFQDMSELLGIARANLRNFCLEVFIPKEFGSPAGDQISVENEIAWRDDYRDTNHNQRFRVFFPHGRIPTSMDMTRLGLALIAESNVFGFTHIPLENDRILGPAENPVALAHRIVEGSEPADFSTEWAKRVKAHLDSGPESILQNDRDFAVFIAAVSIFLEHYEAAPPIR